MQVNMKTEKARNILTYALTVIRQKNFAKMIFINYGFYFVLNISRLQLSCFLLF